jgi:hypothetical protein
MNYALVQTTLTRPTVEALERAFACGRGLTPADARFVADDAYGFLARDLSLEDALFLQNSLATEAVEVRVVPESDLPRVPEPKLFCFAELEPEALVIYDPLERPTRIPWTDIRVVAAGNDGRSFGLELIVGDAELRYSATVDRMQFDRMPHFFSPSEPDNVGEAYRQLVAEIVHRCQGGVPNRAAHILAQDNLSGDVTEAISYPRHGAYLEELTWLLWHQRQPAA